MPMVLVLGDAWALGENQDPEDLPVTALPEHPEHALMFAAGAAPRDKLMGRFKPLTEKQSSWRRETPCSGLADVVMTECAIRFGSKPRMLFAAAGHPQAKLVAREAGAQGFGRGSDVHRSVMNIVSAAKHLAAAEGRKLQLLAFCFAQCRNDENLDGVSRPYWDALLKLRRHYDADCRTITCQSEPIPLLAAQSNRGAARLGKFPAVAAAQLAATDVDPLVRCIGPAYQFDAERNVKDGQAWRLSSNSYRRLGRLFGRYLMDDVLGAGDRPLRAIAARWSGERRILLDYGRPLAIDTSGTISVAELGDGLGIDFVDGPRPSARIVSVGINPIRPARLEIELDREPSGTAPRLYIAARSTGNAKVGRMDGPRSAIRMANPRDHDPRTGEPIYDWACSEVIDVA